MNLYPGVNVKGERVADKDGRKVFAGYTVLSWNEDGRGEEMVTMIGGSQKRTTGGNTRKVESKKKREDA